MSRQNTPLATLPNFSSSHFPVFSYRRAIVQQCCRVPPYHQLRSPRRNALRLSTVLVMDTETRNGISLHGSTKHQTPQTSNLQTLHSIFSFHRSFVQSCLRSVVPSCSRAFVLALHPSFVPSFLKSPRSPEMCFLPRRSDHRIVPVSLPPVGHRRKWKKNPLSGYMLLPSPVAPVH